MHIKEISFRGLQAIDIKTIAELSEACSEVGLFRLVEHGIAADLSTRIFLLTETSRGNNSE